jgi:hypothetical protein
MSGDDQRAVLLRFEQLIAGLNLPRAGGVAQLPFRAIGVRRSKRRSNLFQANAVFADGLRDQLHAHRRKRTASDDDLPHAFHLRNLLLKDGVGQIVQLPDFDRVGGERQQHDRRVGGVDLAVARIARQIRGQLAARRVDRRLNVAGGSVDITVQLELQRDGGRAQVVGRSYLSDSGYAAELAF